MPLTGSDIPTILTPVLNATFMRAYRDYASQDWQGIASVIPSTQDSEPYAWLGALPTMQEFKDERNVKAMAEYAYSLKNKLYEGTVGVDRTAIEDDKFGQIKLRIQQMGFNASKFQAKTIFAALAAGATSLCYDGQYFFDTDHVSGNSGTQSNKGTAALSQASLDTAIATMAALKDDQGEPLGIIPDTLWVPPALWKTGLELCDSPIAVVKVGDGTAGSGATAATGISNVWAGKLTCKMSPYLTDTTDWFLVCSTWPIKPLIWQDRVPVEFAALEGNSDNGFMRDQYMYGTRMRGAAGYGLWQLAYAGIVSG